MAINSTYFLSRFFYIFSLCSCSVKHVRIAILKPSQSEFNNPVEYRYSRHILRVPIFQKRRNVAPQSISFVAALFVTLWYTRMCSCLPVYWKKCNIFSFQITTSRSYFESRFSNSGWSAYKQRNARFNLYLWQHSLLL